ncbi:MAG: cytochrome P450 [Proteobacteria bacterium]|nr:cytochrome P450 [Pseudomonadota bacterium]
MSPFTTSPEIDNALVAPTAWADEAGIHEQLRWLRHNDPLRFVQPTGYEPFWSVTKYNNIKEIEGNKKVFVNDPRPTLGPQGMAEMVQQVTGRKHLIRSLVQMDDPDHSRYRRLTQGWFMGTNLRKLQARIDDLAASYVDRLADLGGECDFVRDVAIWYPLRVIMSILGVPEQDEALMLKLTQELFGSADPDNRRSFEPQDFFKVVEDFEQYFLRLTQDRINNPTDDVATLIANAQLDGKPLPELEAAGYYIIIATAGHDTTSASTAGGLLALIHNPEQMALLRADPEHLLPTAIDEMIRWVTPVRHFMRTATQDYVLNGKTIRKGESAILWYPSANRDEDIFSNPFEFSVQRRDAKQLAFGFGAHVCLGQHLARMEITALYKQLLKRVHSIELAGEPRYVESTFVGGLKSLPIRYRMK